MCGITGIIRPGTNDLRPEIQNALAKIKHRGPDDSSIYTQRIGNDESPFSIGLGHVRLSIIDLSDRGRQPMTGSDGQVIVLNGEIYNYLELRRELKDAGYAFISETDTEVALNAYHFWGEKCVDHFIGMWAMAIWDGYKLYLSRDRLGKKPLYLHHDEQNGCLVFASEIKAFQGIDGVPWRPDEHTVYRYLAFAETERNGRTFYDGIEELPPGCSISYVPGQRQITLNRYWELPNGVADIDEAEAIRKTTDLLFDSMRLRLRSDAPLGLSLSGGLDSTLLLAVMNELGFRTIPVFSAGYIDTGYNETKYIKTANEYFNCRPYYTDTNARHFINDFEELVYHLDQPSKLPGPYSQWRVAELAGRYVKVLVDGQGADELAGGYMYFLPVAWRNSSFGQKLRQTPDFLLTIFANRHIFSQYPLFLIFDRIRGRSGDGHPLALKHEWCELFRDERPEWEYNNDIDEMITSSITQTSLPALLRYGDRTNMAFGVENRCPFLDHRLVEFVSRLPVKLKIRNGTTKWIFRAVAKNRLPDLILRRRLKMGFPTPVGEWLRNKIFSNAKKWLATDDGLFFFSQWIDTHNVRILMDEHACRKNDHHALLWRILSVGAWLKKSDF
jgi:asparagine synthase (glutamine-hydrolysing)